MLSRFLTSQSGNIAVAFCLVAPVLLLATGGAIDFWRFLEARTRLQEIADTAALAGAREYSIGKGRDNVAKTIAEERATLLLNNETDFDKPGYQVVAGANYGGDPSSGGDPGGISSGSFGGGKMMQSLSLSGAESGGGAGMASRSGGGPDAKRKSVVVDLSTRFKPKFLSPIFGNGVALKANSVAVSYNSANLCVLSLDSVKEKRITLTDSAKITGVDCAVFANSTASIGLGAYDNSEIDAAAIHVAGGFEGELTHFTTPPLTDAPVREDPLVTRAAPTGAVCTAVATIIVRGTRTLNPGVYCGGLTIIGTANVTFNPGIYIIRNGALTISGRANVTGVGVGFFLTGLDRRFNFADDATIDLAGPTSGAMAGLLIFQDRLGSDEPDSYITSGNVHSLIGTIYMPKGDLIVETDSEVAEESAFTAIIVDELHVGKSANHVLNSDYQASNVPLPPGLGGPAFVALRQ